MAISLVQTAAGSTGAVAVGSVLGTFSSNVTSGNFIAVMLSFFGNTSGTSGGTSVTDSIGNSYSLAVSSGSVSGSSIAVDIWYSPNITGGSAIVTAKVRDANSDFSMIMREYSGLALTNLIDKVGSQANNAAGSNLNSGTTAVTTNANDLVIAAFCANQRNVSAFDVNYSHGTNRFASNLNDNETITEDLIVSSTGAQIGTAVLAGGIANWRGAIASFKAGSAATSVTVPYLNLMGVGQ